MMIWRGICLQLLYVIESDIKYYAAHPRFFDIAIKRGNAPSLLGTFPISRDAANLVSSISSVIFIYIINDIRLTILITNVISCARRSLALIYGGGLQLK